MARWMRPRPLLILVALVTATVRRRHRLTAAFQFEVGMADLAIGVTACIAFWRDLGFKAAAVWATSIFLFGDAVGHVRQMMIAGNFAPATRACGSTSM
jgi:hypothetical protein